MCSCSKTIVNIFMALYKGIRCIYCYHKCSQVYYVETYPRQISIPSLHEELNSNISKAFFSLSY